MMRDKLAPWLPAIICSGLCLITVIADLAGRFMTGSANVGITTFFCFLPICFLHVGVMLKSLRDENRLLRHKLDEVTSPNIELKKAA
jgi:hypothetical protein